MSLPSLVFVLGLGCMGCIVWVGKCHGLAIGKCATFGRDCGGSEIRIATLRVQANTYPRNVSFVQSHVKAQCFHPVVLATKTSTR